MRYGWVYFFLQNMFADYPIDLLSEALTFQPKNASLESYCVAARLEASTSVLFKRSSSVEIIPYLYIVMD